VFEPLKDSPLNILDVGAATGIQKHWAPWLPYLRVNGLEPRPEEWKWLNENALPNVTYHNWGLSNACKMEKLFVTNKPTASGFFQPNPRYAEFMPARTFGVNKVVWIDCLTYPAFLEHCGLPAQHVIKLDTQGSERLILDTLTAAHWQQLLAVEVEVSFVPLYAGQCLFPEVHGLLTAKGFTLIKLDRHGYWTHRGNFMKTGVGVRDPLTPFFHGDALYVKLLGAEDLVSQPDLLRYLLICRIYGLEDQARFVAAGAGIELGWSPYTLSERMMIFTKRCVPGARALRLLVKRLMKSRAWGTAT